MRKRMILAVMILPIGVCDLLYLPGCSMNAEALGGFSRHGIRVSRNLFGTSAEVDSDVQGSGKVVYDAASKSYNVEFEVNVNRSAVVSAEGERADHLVKLRELDNERIRIQTAAATQIAQQIASMVMSVSHLGADVAGKFSADAAPLLDAAAKMLVTPATPEPSP